MRYLLTGCLLVLASVLVAQSHPSDLVVGNDLWVDGGDITVPVYNADYVTSAGKAGLGPTSPTWGVNDSCMGLAFDADAESVHLSLEVPDCYANGATHDLVLRIYWCGEDLQDPANTEVVKWDISYRSINWGTEDTDNGTAETGTVSYTQSGAGDEGDTHEHEITLDADGANQPIQAGDSLEIHFDRDWSVANNYPHDAIVTKWELRVPQTSPKCNHYN